MSVRNRRRGGHFRRLTVNRGRSGARTGRTKSERELGKHSPRAFDDDCIDAGFTSFFRPRRSSARGGGPFFVSSRRRRARRVRAGDGARTRRTTPSPPPLGRRSVASRKMWLRPCGPRRRRVLVVSRSAAPLHPAAVSVAYRRDPVQTCRARARARRKQWPRCRNRRRRSSSSTPSPTTATPTRRHRSDRPPPSCGRTPGTVTSSAKSSVRRRFFVVRFEGRYSLC